MSRSITGLNPIQSVICTTLDVVDQISINGKVPTTTMPLGFDSTTKTTKYLTDGNYPGDLFVSGNVIKFTNLPTLNPNNAGQLWNDNGTLKIS